MPSTTSTKLETPFTTAAIGSNVDFWGSYIASRPKPTDDFFHFINAYHTSHGDPCTRVAHDVGTGPGNIAGILAPYFDQVVGSDLNASALAAGPALVPPEYLQRMTFVKSPAEELANDGVLPKSVGRGQTDLIVVSECMPLLDAPKALSAFHTLLRPGGTLAIYFYGRPIFTDGDTLACDATYERLATRICRFLLPFKDTPGYPFHLRGGEALVSYLDNIAILSHDWGIVERHKWNCDHPLLFNGEDGFDFDLVPVDRRAEGEITREVIDRQFWVDEWDAERVKAYLDSVYPHYRQKAGEKYSEVKKMVEDLQTAMGGPGVKRRVTFPVVLILATKK
jgi:trans-aconitate 3-methyltransferase